MIKLKTLRLGNIVNNLVTVVAGITSEKTIRLLSTLKDNNVRQKITTSTAAELMPVKANNANLKLLLSAYFDGISSYDINGAINLVADEKSCDYWVTSKNHDYIPVLKKVFAIHELQNLYHAHMDKEIPFSH